MKKIYEAPTSELIYIASADIITTSPVGINFDYDPFDGTEIYDIVDM